MKRLLTLLCLALLCFTACQTSIQTDSSLEHGSVISAEERKESYEIAKEEFKSKTLSRTHDIKEFESIVVDESTYFDIMDILGDEAYMIVTADYPISYYRIGKDEFIKFSFSYGDSKYIVKSIEIVSDVT